MRSIVPARSAALRRSLALLLALVAAVAVAVTATNAAQPGVGTFTTITWGTAAAQPFGNSEGQGEVVGDKLYVFGGFDSQKACCTPTKRAYAYDPSTDRWSPLPDMPGQRASSGTGTELAGGVTHAGFASDARNVYWAGGYISGSAAGTGQTFGTNQVFKYDTVTGAYTELKALPKRTSAVQAEVVNGTLHVFGGTNVERTADLSDHFTLNLNDAAASWVTRNDADKLVARHHMGSTVIGSKIFSVGGQTGHDGGLTTSSVVEVFDTATPNAGWTALAPLPTARGHVSNSTFAWGGRSRRRRR